MSVIIPTYNRARTLERALNSVFNQTTPDWELIVVDDGSTDETPELVAHWREANPCRSYYHRTENRGVSSARNFAVAQADGEWIACLDSDDEWLPFKLEKQLELSREFNLIHSEEIWVRNGKRVNPMKKHQKSGGLIFKRCVEQCCVSPSTVMFKRDVFLALGGFREDFPVCEDYELWLRWSSRYPAGFIATPLIHKYGGHEDQLSLTHRAMDYHRVRALVPFLNNEEISQEERIHVAETLLKKCDILLNGYRKHENFKNVDEIENYRADALNFLTQNHSAHSAALLRPRSEDKLSL